MLSKGSPVYVVFYVCMALLVLITLFPFYILSTGAFKTQREINTEPLALPLGVEVSPNTRWNYLRRNTAIDLEDFQQRFGLEERPAAHRKLNELADSPEELEDMREYIGSQLRLGNVKLVLQRAHLPRALALTMGIVLATVAMLSLTGGMAGYALSISKYRVFNYILMFFILGLILPPMLGLLPLYTMLDKLNLLGTPLALVLVYSAQRMPMTILVFLSFYKAIPSDLEDISKLDGLSRLGHFFRILLPLSKVPILTTFVISGTYVFNDYLTPLVLMPDPTRTTVQVALSRFVGAQTWFFGPIYAGVLVAALPMVAIYLLMNRTFIRGIVAGAVKY